MEIKTRFNVSYANGIEFIGYRQGNYKSRIKNIMYLKRYNQLEFNDLFRDFSKSGALVVIANKRMDWMNDFWIENGGKWYVDFPLKDGYDTKFFSKSCFIKESFFTQVALSGYRYFLFNLYVDSKIWNQQTEREKMFFLAKSADDYIIGLNGLFLKLLGKKEEIDIEFHIKHRLINIDIENFNILN